MSGILNIILTLFVFNVLVIAHEWGHFKTAVKNGILVEEFSVGMGPLVYSKMKGDTMYSVRAFPVGGFCRMLGEDEKIGSDRSFSSKSTWARMAVVVMGPMMNFILCFVIVLGLTATTNAVIFPKVSSLLEGAHSAKQGLEVGDTITKINGEKINTYEDLFLVLDGCNGKDLKVEVKKESGEKQSLTITPSASEDGSRWIIGFKPVIKTGLFEDRIDGYDKVSIGEVLHETIFTMLYFVKSVVVGFVRLFTLNISPEEVSGPIGIVQIVGESVESGLQISVWSAVRSILSITALLSVNLGVINLFPIPAMDGGRLAFLIVETIRGKAIDPEKEGFIHFMGFVLLMAFMVIIASNDIAKLIFG